MASRKFYRKIDEVASQVMDDGEQFVAGVAGQAGAGKAAKTGGWSEGAQGARTAGYVTGGVFNALAILTDQSVYLISTPLLKAYEVKDVVLKQPVDSTEVVLEGRSRLRIADYYLTYTYRMGTEAKRFTELASDTAN